MRIIQRKRNLLSRLVLAQNQILVFDMLLAQLPFEPFAIFHQTQLGRAQFLLLIGLQQNPIDEPVSRDAFSLTMRFSASANRRSFSARIFSKSSRFLRSSS